MPAAVLTGLMVGGTALSAYGQIKAGNAAKDLGEFNAQVAEAQAEDALTRGREDEQRFRMGVRTLIGSQKAGFSGQNVDVHSGSAVDVQADTAFLGELDAQMIQENAQREAWAHRQEATASRKGGSAAATASKFGAASTILGGGASLLQVRYGWGAA